MCERPPRQPVILYRASSAPDPSELEAAKDHFVVLHSRMSIQGSDLVIGRYSVLPFYKELEDDIIKCGGKLINSHKQHRFAADMRNYIEVLQGITPRTWFRLEDVPETGGPYVLKGATNSRKDKWRTHMFAENKAAAVEVYMRLCDDSLINEQGVYIREYVPLVRLATGINDMPVSEEYRFFVCRGRVLCGAFYWSNFTGDLQTVPGAQNVPSEFLSLITRAIGNNIEFYAIDVARTESGDWIVVEVNDGQMSGLSDNDPKALYKNLKDLLWHYKVPA